MPTPTHQVGLLAGRLHQDGQRSGPPAVIDSVTVTITGMAEVARPVFISYARLDQPLVARAVEFLRGGGPNVFVDSQNIAYGTDWRQALGDAIENAERVMLFWTAAAAVSRWVTREWQLALKRGKKVVPTLLDDTPLPPALARLQAVTTLRGLFPAPMRRPEDLIAESVMPDDESEDEGLDAGAAGSRWARSNLLPPRCASSGSRAPPQRLTLIVAILVVVGVVGWVSLQRTGSVPDRPYPAPAVAAMPASAAASAVGVPASAAASAVQASASSATPSGSAAASAAAAASEPALLDAELDTFRLVQLVALVLLAVAARLLLRRLTNRRRARAIVHQVYAM